MLLARIAPPYPQAGQDDPFLLKLFHFKSPLLHTRNNSSTECCLPKAFNFLNFPFSNIFWVTLWHLGYFWVSFLESDPGSSPPALPGHSSAPQAAFTGHLGTAAHNSCLFPPSCSAGVGRTGVFITLSIVLERMRYEGVVDIFQTVKMLRTQRPAMVQTEVRGPVLCQESSQGLAWLGLAWQWFLTKPHLSSPSCTPHFTKEIQNYF